MRASVNNYILIVSVVLNIVAGKYFLDTNSFHPFKIEKKQVTQKEIPFNDVQEVVPGLAPVVSQSVALKPAIKKASKKTKMSNPILFEELEHISNQPEVINQSSASIKESNTLMELPHLSIPDSITNIQDTCLNIDSINVEGAYEDEPTFIQPIEKELVESGDTLQNQKERIEKHIPVLEMKETASVDKPISEKVSFRLNVTDNTNVKVIWADKNGKVLTVSNSMLVKGFQKVSLDTSDVSSGTYIIDIVDASNNTTLKSVRFIK